MTTSASATLATLAGRGPRSFVSVVQSSPGVVDVLAGSVVLRAIPVDLLLAFVADVLTALDTRTGARQVVPVDSGHPEAAALVHGRDRLRLLDDGETVTVMALVDGEKGGAGTAPRAEDVRRFVTELRDELAGGAR